MPEQCPIPRQIRVYRSSACSQQRKLYEIQAHTDDKFKTVTKSFLLIWVVLFTYFLYMCFFNIRIIEANIISQTTLLKGVKHCNALTVKLKFLKINVFYIYMLRLLLLLLMIFPMFSNAQSVEVKYSVYSRKRTEVINKIKNAKENQNYLELLSDLPAEKQDSFILVVKDRKSSFERIEPEEELSDYTRPKIIIVNPSFSEENTSVYKNFVDMTVTESKNLLGKTYLINYQLSHYKWKVLPDTKKIMGLTTYKAMIGDSITAWFSPAIPIQDGPGLFYGLPGLIIDLDDGHTIYSCTALNTKSTLVVGKPSKGKKVTADEFEKLRKCVFNR